MSIVSPICRPPDLQRPPRPGLAVAVGGGGVRGAGDIPERRRHPRRTPRAHLLPQRGRSLSVGRAARSGPLRRYPPSRPGRALGDLRAAGSSSPTSTCPGRNLLSARSPRAGATSATASTPRPASPTTSTPSATAAACPRSSDSRATRCTSTCGRRRTSSRFRPTFTAGAASTARPSPPIASPSGSTIPNTTTSRRASAPESTLP